MIKAPRLTPGGTIGLCSPSHIAKPEEYRQIIDTFRRKGYSVREGNNLYKATYGYLASPQERAADFNQLIDDPEVELVMFGGGEGSVELLPYLDFDNMARHPKLILSYSDGTTILNDIWAKTGLETYYGQSPNMYTDLRCYDYEQFLWHMADGHVTQHVPNSPWLTQTHGTARGILTGGYTRNFALLLGSPYFSWEPDGRYLLFLEDHEQFGAVDYVSAMLANIEQSPFISTVTGLIFGHYSALPCRQLLNRLERFGKDHKIPVVYCDDFGHGSNHAILPIGHMAELDTEPCRLRYV